ncbi:MAG: hypothetical protein ACFB6R_04920 [Alphaproteobacteria bacterium]
MLRGVWAVMVVSVAVGLGSPQTRADPASPIALFRGAKTPQTVTLPMLPPNVSDLSVVRQNAKGLPAILYPVTDYAYSRRDRRLRLARPMGEGELLLIVPTATVPHICGPEADRTFGILMEGCLEALVTAAEAPDRSTPAVKRRSVPQALVPEKPAQAVVRRPDPTGPGPAGPGLTGPGLTGQERAVDNEADKEMGKGGGAPGLAGASFVHVLTETTGLPGVPDNIKAWAGSNRLYPGGGRRGETVIAVTAKAGSPVLQSTDPLAAGAGTTSVWPAVVKWPDRTFSVVTVIGTDAGDRLTLRGPLQRSGPGELGPLFSARLGQHLSRIGTQAYAWMVARRSLRDTVKGARLSYHGAKGEALAGPNDISTGSTMWSPTAVSAEGPRDVVNGIRRGVMVSRRLNPWRTAHGRTYLARPTVVHCGIEIGTLAQWEGVETRFALRGRDARFEAFVIADPGDATVPRGRPTALVMLVDATGETVAHQWVPDRLTRVTLDIPARLASGRILIVHPGAEQTGQEAAFSIGVFNAGIWENDIDPSRPLIGPGETWVTVGDSWFAWYDGVFATALADYSDAGAVVNYSKGGKKARWAAQELDAILAAHPDADGILLHFAINDLNDAVKDFSSEGERFDKWLADLSSVTRRAQARGIRVAIMMPPVTASRSQTSMLQQWASHLNVGETVSVASR